MFITNFAGLPNADDPLLSDQEISKWRVLFAAFLIIKS